MHKKTPQANCLRGLNEFKLKLSYNNYFFSVGILF